MNSLVRLVSLGSLDSSLLYESDFFCFPPQKKNMHSLSEQKRPITVKKRPSAVQSFSPQKRSSAKKICTLSLPPPKYPPSPSMLKVSCSVSARGGGDGVRRCGEGGGWSEEVRGGAEVRMIAHRVYAKSLGTRLGTGFSLGTISSNGLLLITYNSLGLMHRV